MMVDHNAVITLSKKGQNPAEIAKKLGCSVNAVYMHLKKERKAKKANGHTVDVSRHDNGEIVEMGSPMLELAELEERVRGIAKTLVIALEEKQKRTADQLTYVRGLAN